MPGLKDHQVCLMKSIASFSMGNECTRTIARDEPHLKQQRDNGDISVDDYNKNSCQ